MALTKIYSDRYYQTGANYHLVYEWEDELARDLKIPIQNSPFPSDNIFTKISGKIGNRFFSNDLTSLFNKQKLDEGKYLYFEMSPKKTISFSNYKNAIPVIIDFWNKSNIESFKYAYRKCEYLLVTSLEIMKFLEKENLGSKLIHFPLSLPDKYKIDPHNSDQKFHKKYDIVLAGRTNPILWSYLKEYEKYNPDLEYLYQELQKGELYYRSNKNGIVGNFHSREDYIGLIKSAKVSFYSTPGIDGGETRTEGFNPITPRFFELLASGCHIIARYPNNEESEFYQLDTICPSIKNYEQFKKQLDLALNSKTQPIKKNAEYLSNHYTSTRTYILKKII